RYRHDVDRHPAPLDPNFSGAGRCLTDGEGRYRFTTIKPGAYPWRNHDNAWRPAHIHFSIFGRAFVQRLVTQMYFPGDPLFSFDPIFNAVRDPRARAVGAGGAPLGPLRHRRRGAIPLPRPSRRAAARRIGVRARPLASPADAHLPRRRRRRRGRDTGRAARRRGIPIRHPDAGRSGDVVLRALTAFERLFVPDAFRDAVAERAWLDAMLDAERALANAGSLVGVIPAAAAAA